MADGTAPAVGVQSRGGQPARGYAAARFSFPAGVEAAPAGGGLAAVILAAGAGTRFGGDVPKPLARLGNRTLIGHAVAAATLAGIRPLVVVVGHRGDEVAAGAGTLARIVENPDWAQGLSTSLRAALASLMSDPGIGAVALALADQPGIGSEAWRRVASTFREGSQLAVATYGGRRGHPVLIGRSHWTEAMGLSGDEGARSLFERHPFDEIPCDGTGDPADVDTTEDLAALDA